MSSSERSGLRPSSDLELDLLIHDLKGPVAVAEAAVRSLLERRDRYGALSDKQEVVLRRALRGVQRSHSLIRDLLEIGRAEAGRITRRRFCLGPALTHLLLESLDASSTPIEDWPALDPAEQQLALRDAGVSLEIADDQAAMEIEYDETKLLQILGNLVRNGLQARRGHLSLRAWLADGELLFEVEDDGPGVPEAQRELIFDRYARAANPELGSKPGHGLGLAGVRYLARLLGGEVSLENAAGAGGSQGARFRITLPLEVRTA